MDLSAADRRMTAFDTSGMVLDNDLHIRYDRLLDSVIHCTKGALGGYCRNLGLVSGQI